MPPQSPSTELNDLSAEERVYLNIIEHILGIRDHRQNLEIPCEVKCIFLALTCQSGPLSDLIAKCGLLPEVSLAPTQLTLLSRCSTWTGNATDKWSLSQTSPISIFPVR